MFKSVSIKYMCMFMAIFILCFTMLSVIASSLINSYGTEQRMNSLNFACLSIRDYVENGYAETEEMSFTDYLAMNENDFRPAINLLSGNIGKMLVIITDMYGEIIISGGSDGVTLDTETVFGNSEENYISPWILDKVISEGKTEFSGDGGGYYKEDNYVSAVEVFTPDKQFIGAVIVSSSDNGIGQLTSDMKNMLILAALVVMVIAIILTYYPSEKIVLPLREMSNAAEALAKGQFDIRIKVSGKDEVAQLATAFNSMAQSLEELEDMRRSFIANVSHELRTPMTTIKGFVDSILLGAIPSDKRDYYLGIVSDEITRLSRLVLTLLDISRMQAGEKKFNMTNFDVCETARQVLISFEQRIDEKKLDVFFDVDDDNIFVNADTDSVHQVIYNLCENGIKFSREGGKYGITVRKTDNSKAEIAVFNEGVGLKEDEIRHVFDRFYKTDKSRGFDKTGVGLGLYIVRTIIESHGENIHVESEYGKWCKFVFTLPLSKNK